MCIFTTLFGAIGAALVTGLAVTDTAAVAIGAGVVGLGTLAVEVQQLLSVWELQNKCKRYRINYTKCLWC